MINRTDGNSTILSGQKAQRLRLLVTASMKNKQLNHVQALGLLNEHSVCDYSLKELSLFLKAETALCTRSFAIGLASVLGLRSFALDIINSPKLINWNGRLLPAEQVAIYVTPSNTSEVELTQFTNMCILRTYLSGCSIDKIGEAHGLANIQVEYRCLSTLYNLRINAADDILVFSPILVLDDVLIDRLMYLRLLEDCLERHCQRLVPNF